jgi:hypothetical protein
MLKDYGQVMLVPLSPEQNPSGYFPYYEEYKETEIDNKKAIYYKVYKESHTMNSKEFWVLIKGLEAECQEQDIEILEEKKLREMMERYEERV